MKLLVGAFNQEKALVSVIVKTDGSFAALVPGETFSAEFCDRSPLCVCDIYMRGSGVVCRGQWSLDSAAQHTKLFSAFLQPTIHSNYGGKSSTTSVLKF